MKEMPKELEDWANEHADDGLLEAANRHVCRVVMGSLTEYYPEIKDSPELAKEDEEKYQLLHERATERDKTLMGRRIIAFLEENYEEIVKEGMENAERRFREERLRETSYEKSRLD